MSEKVYKSAGVFSTETDLSQPTLTGPMGVPAGVIGVATDGPAFVPITLGTFSDYTAVFGAPQFDAATLGRTPPDIYGPMAVYTFLRNATALTYLRVLGVGDGNQRSTSTGKVTRAGFAVGSNLVQNDGIVGANPSAVGLAHPYAPPGRTYFMGCFMSESAGSTVFSDANIQIVGENRSAPILRGVLMAPSGVIPQLSCSHAVNSNAPSVTDEAIPGAASVKGGMSGSVKVHDGEFVLLLNGHIPNGGNSNVITASFDSNSGMYFPTKLNKDPTLLQKKGHCLYSWYDLAPGFAIITGSGVVLHADVEGTGDSRLEDVGFITTGSQARDTYTAGVSPNYESFQERFTAAKTPHFISQDFGGTKYNLFRIKARGDGAIPSSKYKISIVNISPANATATDKFGTFDVLVREFDDTDDSPAVLEGHLGCNLDLGSDKYIGRVIGDQQVFFDFDQAAGSQKLVVEGNFPGNSSLIRVEIPKALELGNVPDDALPMGFRGPDHLVTSGSGPLADLESGAALVPTTPYKEITEPPIRYRDDVKRGTPGDSSDILANANLFWGVQFEMRVANVLITDPYGSTKLRSLNGGGQDLSLVTKTKFFPSFSPGAFNFSVGDNPGTAAVNGTVLDCDAFNNNIFTLERIRIKTGSSGDIADPDFWHSASYIRKGSITPGFGMRALNVNDLRTSGNRTFAKYSVYMQGGFDGTDIFDIDKADFTSTACKREMDDSINQGGVSGPTVATYRKALDLMGVKADVDVKLLTIPGIRHSSVTDYAMSTVENRFDALYIMDIEQRSQNNVVMTGSVAADGSVIIPSVTYTAAGFAARGLDSSFAAAYYPDVVIDIGYGSGEQVAPPSVAVMGAMSRNDYYGQPFNAPAGFSRARLDASISACTLPLERDDLDKLYEERINPLVEFVGQDPVVWGQKTLMANASALDRINVRRLLIDIRRKVKNIANSLLFEPNRQETLDRFNALVKPIMQTIQDNGGVDRYKVIIDTTTTTQADIENNTIRGKIYLQPTRTAEFIALDFTVANAGNFDSV